MFLKDLNDNGVARITLDRPEVHNAFNEELIAALSAEFAALSARDDVRVVVLASSGKSFSAGADLNWMKRMAGYGEAENLADAKALAEMLDRLNRMRQPTVALVQGAAFGGGVGLVACCDIALASEVARFSLSEVRLGLIPGTISPYVLAAIGSRAARRYFTSAERFSAAEALRLGLVHEVVPADQLEDRADRLLSDLLSAGPRAQVAAKQLVFEVDGRPLDQATLDLTARRIADIRATPEGREGVQAFLEKRKPAWVDL